VNPGCALARLREVESTLQPTRHATVRAAALREARKWIDDLWESSSRGRDAAATTAERPAY
jgi:hypothetical protein